MTWENHGEWEFDHIIPILTAALLKIAIGTTVAATAVTAYSAVQQGRSAAAQAKQDAAWLDYNAKVANIIFSLSITKRC